MITNRVVLKFPHKLVDHPIVYNLVKEYDLAFNILRAKVTPKEEGELVIELKGEEDNYNRGIQYLRHIGVNVEPLSKEITRDEKRCTHCGVCVALCPSEALFVLDAQMHIGFSPDKCIACEICIRGCPPRAMKVKI